MYANGETGFSKDDILNSEKLKIYWMGRMAVDTFRGVRRSFSSDECETINFTGINLFCFNRVTTKFESRTLTVKEDNLQYIIPYVTILKYTSKARVHNGLVGRDVYPYEFVKNEGTTFYDGSHPELYDKSLEDIRCTEDKGGANLNADENIAYICQDMLSGDLVNTIRNNGLSNAAILYHEVNHIYDNGHICYHEEDRTWSLGERFRGVSDDGDTIDSECICAESESHLRTRDKDFNTVYGTHINYLFSMSQNDILNCEERENAFLEAEKEMNAKLCQYPDVPIHSVSRPICD